MDDYETKRNETKRNHGARLNDEACSAATMTPRLADSFGGAALPSWVSALRVKIDDATLDADEIRVARAAFPTLKATSLSSSLPSDWSSPLAFSTVHLSNQQGLGDAAAATLPELLEAHYATSLSGQVLSLVGSSDLIGNPVALLSDIGRGLQDLVERPVAGLKSGGGVGLLEGLGEGGALFAARTMKGLAHSTALVIR